MRFATKKKLVRFDSCTGDEYQDLATSISERLDLRLDAGETVFFARQLEFVYAQPREVLYAPLKFRSFIPIDNSVPDWAETFTYTVYDKVGLAKILTSYRAKDIPEIGLTGKQVTGNVKPIGDKFSYDMQSIKRAQKTGMPLERTKEIACFQANETLMDQLAATGDATYGLPGFVNNANVPLVTPTNGTWTTGPNTPTEIVADLNKLVNAIVTATSEVHIPDTLLLAPALYGYIASTPWSGASDTTILKWFLANNPYIKNVDQWARLATADAGGTGPRIVCYKRDPSCVAMVVPLESQRSAPQVDGLAVEVFVTGRVGGVKVEHPLSMAYMDGC
jgi:hypothetical protein